MSNSADFIALQAEIEAFPEDELKNCSMPMATYFSEAETLEKVALEDKEKLVKAGLEPEKVEKLGTLTGAAREAQSLWKADRFSKADAQEQWDAQEEGACDLIDECLHAFTYGYRNDEHLMGRVADIEEGTGQADMVQDLNDIAVLGREHPEPLEAIGFDMTLIDAAAEMAAEMADLLARKDSASDKNERRIIRDKAFSLLKMVVDDIYACGQYVFWKDKERCEMYSSAYRKAYNKKRYRKKMQETIN